MTYRTLQKRIREIRAARDAAPPGMKSAHQRALIRLSMQALKLDIKRREARKAAEARRASA